MFETAAQPSEPREQRKTRGAFFTPESIAQFIAQWSVRNRDDTVLEPSAGDAAFLVAAVDRLKILGTTTPRVDGVEIHQDSANVASARVKTAGGTPHLTVGDFFEVEPTSSYSVVIGNPPFIRYQDFTGETRARSRTAALKAGVTLTALASSWAAFTIHASLFLKQGGRMGLVLPAELLSVNYAAAIRKFLFKNFRSVDLVLFTEQVFPDAETDVVLLLAEGYGDGPTDHATIYQTPNADALNSLSSPLTWTPDDPAAKWTGALVNSTASTPLRTLLSEKDFTTLDNWGETTLGMVTGNNKYFTLSPARVKDLGLTRKDLLRLSPPGSTHLRGLELSKDALTQLGRGGKSTWLFRPSEPINNAAQSYIDAGQLAGVNEAYKCRIRKLWYKVPLVPPADLLLTCMNADTPRLTTNTAKAHHLNSIHGVYLNPIHADLGKQLLPIASLNSATLLSAEIVGRSYGGGILKLEPSEADVWAMPSPKLVQACSASLLKARPYIAKHLNSGNLDAAVELVDRIMLLESGVIPSKDLDFIKEAYRSISQRRKTRGRSGH